MGTGPSTMGVVLAAVYVLTATPLTSAALGAETLSQAPATEDTGCLGRLSALGVVYKKVPPVDPEGLCDVAEPLEVSELGSGVSITPPAVVNCMVAESLARWVKESVVAKAEEFLGEAPKHLQASGYACATRDRIVGAKLSEHAHANAVDVGRISFDKRQAFAIKSQMPSSPEAHFQDGIRKDACTYFTTVLGPGSDSYHGEHLHLDMAQRRSGYRLCQ